MAFLCSIFYAPFFFFLRCINIFMQQTNFCEQESNNVDELYQMFQVYVAEADGIPEYGMSASLGKRLVAVKFLLNSATEKEKCVINQKLSIFSLGIVIFPNSAKC